MSSTCYRALAPETQTAIEARIAAYALPPSPTQFNRARTLLLAAAKTAPCAKYLLITAYIYGGWGISINRVIAIELMETLPLDFPYQTQIGFFLTDQLHDMKKYLDDFDRGDFIPLEAFLLRNDHENALLRACISSDRIIELANIGSIGGIGATNLGHIHPIFISQLPPADMCCTTLYRWSRVKFTSPGPLFDLMWLLGWWKDTIVISKKLSHSWIDSQYRSWCHNDNLSEVTMNELMYYLGQNRTHLPMPRHTPKYDLRLVDSGCKIYQARVTLYRRSVYTWLCVARMLRVCSDIARFIGRLVYAGRFCYTKPVTRSWCVVF
jgi:hypothetical protein